MRKVWFIPGIQENIHHPSMVKSDLMALFFYVLGPFHIHRATVSFCENIVDFSNTAQLQTVVQNPENMKSAKLLHA